MTEHHAKNINGEFGEKKKDGVGKLKIHPTYKQ